MIDWNKPVQTRDGRSVRILTTTEGSEEYPVIGMIEGKLCPDCWTTDGHIVSGDDRYSSDLVNIKEKGRYRVAQFTYDLELASNETTARQCEKDAEFIRWLTGWVEYDKD